MLRNRSRNKRSVRLNIERLETRDCPAVAILECGDALRILGDADNDQIAIVDHGGGDLTVNGADYSGIQRLVINTKGGADEVSFEADGVLSLSSIDIKLGAGNDTADLKLGAVAGELRSRIRGGAGNDAIATAVDAVFAHGDARSFAEGGQGNDVIQCVQKNVAADARAECNSDGGRGNDTLMCTAVDVAGQHSCVGNGGQGNDVVFCMLTNLAATGTASCQQTGGAGNDDLTCAKVSIQGTHHCFGDGGAGNDTLNWLASGQNSGQFTCAMRSDAGDDVIKIDVSGTFTGTVDYFADTGRGDDTWDATVNFDAASTGVFQSLTVQLGRGDDTLNLTILGLGQTIVMSSLYSGGPGQDTYVEPLGLPFPVEDFEIGV